jgi:hypothetical protein
MNIQWSILVWFALLISTTEPAFKASRVWFAQFVTETLPCTVLFSFFLTLRSHGVATKKEQLCRLRHVFVSECELVTHSYSSTTTGQ